MVQAVIQAALQKHSPDCIGTLQHEPRTNPGRLLVNPGRLMLVYDVSTFHIDDCNRQASGNVRLTYLDFEFKSDFNACSRSIGGCSFVQ